MKHHFFLNMTTYTGQHFTQQSFADRKAELWRKRREAQTWGSNREGQHGSINTKTVNQHRTIELLKLGE